MKRTAIVTAVVALLMVGVGSAYGQTAFKCKNAAGVVQYSDKPCPPMHEEVPWRPKYSPASVTRLESDDSDKANKSKDAASAANRTPARKSAYTRWLDSKEEAQANPK